MEAWVTIDDDEDDRCCVSHDEPDEFEGKHDVFHMQSCFTPRKGSCKQYELSLKEIK